MDLRGSDALTAGQKDLLCSPARPEASVPPVMPSADPLCPLIIEDEDPFIPSKGWAEMIKKVYEIDPLICPKCGGPCELFPLLKITKS